MNKILESLIDLSVYIKDLGQPSFTSAIYRGQSIDYELVPKIGRLLHIHHPKIDEPDEVQMLDIFKKQALPYLDSTTMTSDWDWLTNAQHYGLPTRLLDWTRNPLVACFFAVEKKLEKEDSVIYVLKKIGKVEIEKHSDPFAVTDVYKVIPNHVNRRIIAQAGLFTIHPKPREPFESEEIDRLTIPNEARQPLREELYKFGIHPGTVFPELGGLSKLIEWRRTKPRSN